MPGTSLARKMSCWRPRPVPMLCRPKASPSIANEIQLKAPPPRPGFSVGSSSSVNEPLNVLPPLTNQRWVGDGHGPRECLGNRPRGGGRCRQRDRDEAQEGSVTHESKSPGDDGSTVLACGFHRPQVEDSGGWGCLLPGRSGDLPRIQPTNLTRERRIHQSPDPGGAKD